MRVSRKKGALVSSDLTLSLDEEVPAALMKNVRHKHVTNMWNREYETVRI